MDRLIGHFAAASFIIRGYTDKGRENFEKIF